MLRDFISTQREEILARARRRNAQRDAPADGESDAAHGLPRFLDQLDDALARSERKEAIDELEIQRTAMVHGGDLFQKGLDVTQVVHAYGDLCPIIMELAIEQGVAIHVEDVRSLNICLDDAIAGAVAEYGTRRERALSGEGTERLGALAHELRNLLNTALLSFASIRQGTVAPGGSTGDIHYRSLLGLKRLVDRSLSDVRLDAGIQNMQRIAVKQLFEEMDFGAELLARKRDVRFSLTTPDPAVEVEADQQILSAAVFNLLQNAFKYTRPNSTVSLLVRTSEGGVFIDVEDECGGLPPGKAEDLLRPFEQRGRDRSGLGLGLSICVKAARAMAGELRIRDLPGKGCVFTICLPAAGPASP